MATGGPEARCHDVYRVRVSHLENISFTADDIDNNSTGLDISLAAGPLQCCGDLRWGSNEVTLTVTDRDGLTDQCIADLQVVYDGLADVPNNIAYNGTFQDFRIPQDASVDQLTVTLVGGAGGEAERFAWPCDPINTTGGPGAEMQLTFDLGCELGELRHGGLLRFVIGEKGDSESADGGACIGTTSGGGGGGTGLLYSGDGGCNWHLLAVAGGGGGATAETSHAHNGKAGLHDADQVFENQFGGPGYHQTQNVEPENLGMGGLVFGPLSDLYEGAGGGGANGDGELGDNCDGTGGSQGGITGGAGGNADSCDGTGTCAPTPISASARMAWSTSR